MVYMDEWEYHLWLEQQKDKLTVLPEDDQTASQEVPLEEEL